MKFKSLLFVLALSIGALASCDPSNPLDSNGKFIPTYKGMSLYNEESQTQSEESILINDSVKSKKDNGNHYGWENGNKHESDDTIESEIEDLVNLDISDTTVTEYFVDLEEDFIITINFENPDQFEILSFTLNGKVFANNMFEDGSNLSTIYIEWEGYEVPGYHELTIDAVKYIDGTEIKDGRYDGNKTIKVGVAYDEIPSVKNFVATTINEEFAYAGSFEFVDPYNIIDNEDDVIFVVSDGENVIHQQNVKVGSNNFSIGNLFPLTTYQYSILAKFDVADGNNETLHILEKGTFSIDDLFTFEVTGTTNSSVTVNAKSISSVTIEELCIHEESIDAPESEILPYFDGTESYTFENLYSNYNYYVGIVYTYLVDGATYYSYAHIPATTVSNQAPTLNIKENRISFNNAMIDVVISNRDYIISSTATIYEVGQIDPVQTINSPNGTVRFDGLISNTEYKVVVSVIYNLNDSHGNVELSKELTFRTLTKSAPTVTVSGISATYNTVTFNVAIKDSHKTGIEYRYEMIKDSTNEIFKEGAIVNGVNKIENAYAGNTYNFKIYAKYQLEVNAPVEEVIAAEFSATTTSLSLPTIQIINEDIGYRTISFGVNVKDPSNIISAREIKVYDFDKDVKTEIYSSDKFNDINKLVDLKTNHQYILEVSVYYDLSDGNGTQKLTETRTYTTLKYDDVTIDFSIHTLNQHTVAGYAYFNNPSKFTLEKSVTLYTAKGDSIENLEIVPVETQELALDSDSFEFNNLLSNNIYMLEFATKVDYLDGNGEQEIKKQHIFFTTEYATPELKVELAGIEENSLKVNYSIQDVDNRLTSVKFELFKVEGEERSLVYEQKLYAGLNILPNLTAGCSYQYVLTYTYDLNDGLGAQEVVFESEVYKLPDPNAEPEEPEVPEVPEVPEHTHEFIEGKCECGEVDPDYKPEIVDPENPIDPTPDQPEHTHEFIDGKCECGEVDPDYVPEDPTVPEEPEVPEVPETPVDPEEPEVPEHTHEFIEGKCECGETDPDYNPEVDEPTVDPEEPETPVDPEVPEHTHEFIEGKCECGEVDPDYNPEVDDPTVEPEEPTVPEEPVVPSEPAE